jgi:putative FmdB family regulatory protein
MPSYEYTCGTCGAHLEVMQKISDKPLARHARCGGKLTKEWSQTSFQLKGSGWYVTDYAGRKSEAKDGKETKPESKEAKPEAADAKAKEPKAAEAKSAAKESKAAKPATTGGD